MTTKRQCLNCTFSQWSGNMLTCTNDESDEHLMYVKPDFMCDEFYRYIGSGSDESDMAGDMT